MAWRFGDRMPFPEPCLCGATDCPRCYPYSYRYDEEQEEEELEEDEEQPEQDAMDVESAK